MKNILVLNDDDYTQRMTPDQELMLRRGVQQAMYRVDVAVYIGKRGFKVLKNRQGRTDYKTFEELASDVSFGLLDDRQARKNDLKVDPETGDVMSIIGGVEEMYINLVKNRALIDTETASINRFPIQSMSSDCMLLKKPSGLNSLRERVDNFQLR